MSQYGDKPSDPTPADNTSSDPTKVGCPPVGTSNETVPLLCTTKNDGDPLLSAPRGATDLDASIFQGKPFTYTIRVTNTHATDDIASDPGNTVVVTDNLPPGMSVAGASVSGGGSCSSAPESSRAG